MVAAYLATGHTDLAVDAVKRCHVSGVEPSVDSLKALVVHLTMNDDSSRAEALMRAAQQRGIQLRPLWLGHTTALFRRGAYNAAQRHYNRGLAMGW